MSASNHIADPFEPAFRQCCDLDMSLNQRLAAFAGEVRRLDPAFAASVDRLVERLQHTRAGKAAPERGDPMPPFLLPDERGRLVSLEEMVSGGPLAVTFHRGHWCPYCRITVAALARAQQDLRDAGSQIVVIMPEVAEFAVAFKVEAGASFPVLSDLDNAYALDLNLAIWVGAEMETMIAAAGFDVPRYQGNPAWMVPIPATFVVGTDGVIRARFVDADYRRRVEIGDLLGALRAAV
jgi:peroxiredoxin